MNYGFFDYGRWIFSAVYPFSYFSAMEKAAIFTNSKNIYSRYEILNLPAKIG